MYKNYIIILLFSIVLHSCNKGTIEQNQTKIDTGYFPIELGLWKIYNVTDIIIDEPANLFDTTAYQLKEIYHDWYIDGEGDSVIIIKRFKRENSDENWQEVGMWQAGLKDNLVVQTEENIKYVKLNFPVKLGKTWDGDAYNVEDTIYNYTYTFTTVDSVEIFSNNTFERVTTVRQKYKSTPIDKIYFCEKYQYGLGLIYREKMDIYSGTVVTGVPVEDRISKGTLYFQTIIDYGKN